MQPRSENMLTVGFGVICVALVEAKLRCQNCPGKTAEG